MSLIGPSFEDSLRLPMAYGGCTCCCHRDVGVVHVAACCHPEPVEPVHLTPYQKGYVANVGDYNPYGAGTTQRGDWNEGFFDRRAGRPAKTGKHYGQAITARQILSYRRAY